MASVRLIPICAACRVQERLLKAIPVCFIGPAIIFSSTEHRAPSTERWAAWADWGAGNTLSLPPQAASMLTINQYRVPLSLSREPKNRGSKGLVTRKWAQRLKPVSHNARHQQAISLNGGFRDMANDDKSIRNLISVLRDSEKGFLDIGEHIKRPELKSYFLEESRVRASYAAELEKTVNRVTDADVHESGTVSGALHRIWGDVKAHLGASDHSLLETAEQGEDVAKRAYREALEDPAVSDSVRALIAQQAEHVNRSHDKVKEFRDTATA
jgi:uncharacterized protein (TIGR02284 family)